MHVCLNDSLPKPLEHRAALLSVGVIVGAFDLFRQIVGNQRLHSILGAILDRLLVVPAFEPLVLIAGYLSAFAASRARRVGFFAGSFALAGSSPKNESFSHSLATNRRISSSDGSAPKTMRAAPYLPSSTCSASPT